MVNAFRYGFLGITYTELWASFGITLLITVLLLGVCIYYFKKGIGLEG